MIDLQGHCLLIGEQLDSFGIRWLVRHVYREFNQSADISLSFVAILTFRPNTLGLRETCIGVLVGAATGELFLKDYSSNSRWILNMFPNVFC